MQRALSRKLIGARAHRELLAYLRQQLPPFVAPDSKAGWLRRAESVRRQVLEILLRGHPAGLLREQPRVEWTGVLPGHGYRIRKLRYEGYPGMWIPALLYEPLRLRGRVPGVLNPNGHHAGGKAMKYKQARCINLAKRGVLALSPEFIGMGELRADVEHNRIAHLDLCGVSGVGVFYLAIARGLDVLLTHAHADPERVGVTGLSGGGWQTAVLSALDERVRLIAPVAGHSPVWQRTGWVSDIGDLEQIPCDLCTAADYDVLTALFAPRPTLLTYNRNDDCCFQTRRTRKSIYEPVKPVFALLDAADRLAFHDNVDPGTHNYERDNRRRFYCFLHEHWGVDGPDDDLPWQDELRTEAELSVGLPPDNATLLSLAQQALRRIRDQRRRTRKPTPAQARRRLSSLLRVPAFSQVQTRPVGATRPLLNYAISQHLLTLDRTWTVPLTELAPPAPEGVELILNDGGRAGAAAMAEQALVAGRTALVADLYGTGEAATSWQYHMILAATGQRPLGLQVGQLQVLIRWACRHSRKRAVHVRAAGQWTPVVALIAAALDPAPVAGLRTAGLLDSLARLIDWPVPYASAAPLFCFGLLREFDIADLLELADPVPVCDEGGRGPLR